MGFYLLIAVVLLMTIFALRGGMGNQEKVTYAQVRQLLEQQMVSRVSLEDNTVTLYLKEPQGGQSVLTYQIGNPDWFYQDFNDLIVEQKRQGIITDYDYPQGWVPPYWMSFIPWIVILVVFGLLGYFMFLRQAGAGGGGGGGGGVDRTARFGRARTRTGADEQKKVTFEDVAGAEEEKGELQEIVEFLRDPKRFLELGARIPKGVLLVGPPGTGKTLLAKAVAGEAHVPFFSISGSEFVEMFVGMGAARVRDLFRQAAQKAPCIVFIDEIDTIGKSRDGAAGMGGNDEREQTLNQLLTEMDGFDGSKGVIILAATNRPETLDKALLRPGRFDRRIPVELPDLEGRAAILKVHARKVMMDENVDYMAIARATSGASGAELANMINEAALLAVKNGRRIVRQSDLEEAVETVIAGYQRKNKVLSQKEKRIVAYHEIGHALVAAKQTDSAPVTKITIVPRTSGALGYTMQVPQEETNLLSREEALNKIATFTGGRAAEELIFGSYTSGASNDIEQATRLARSMVTRLGMSRQFDMMALETTAGKYLNADSTLACSEGTAEKIDEEVLAIIKSAHEKAINILKENIDKLHELAAFLMERESITGEEFMEILNREPSPAPAAQNGQ